MVSAPDNATWSKRIAQRRCIAEQYPDFSYVSRAADVLLRKDNSIWSIWLFGSRAKGTARTDSDWDIALITSAYMNGRSTTLAPAPSLKCAVSNIEINCIQIPIDIFLKKRLVMPHLAWAIAAEGVPLAQRRWRLPIHQTNEVFVMDLAEYHRHLSQIHDRLHHISNAYEILADPDRVNLWHAECDLLQDDTQAMAEGFIKAGCIQRGYGEFPRVHSFDEIAASVRAALHDESFASTIEELNGNSSSDHQVRYFANQEPSLVSGAVTRLCKLCDNLPHELQQQSIAFRRDRDAEAFAKLSDLAKLMTSELDHAQQTLSRVKQPDIVAANLDENTVARVERAWEGRGEIQRAMVRARRELEIHFR